MAVLACQVEGSMRHNLTWHRAGHTIRARAGRVKLLPDSSLQISGVRTQDAGEYHCVATNAHGDIKITVWLLVPGTVGWNPAGHLLKHLTHQGLMAPLRPPSSGFHHWLNFPVVRLSHFLVKKCYSSASEFMLVENCVFYCEHGMVFVINFKNNICETPHDGPPVMSTTM